MPKGIYKHKPISEEIRKKMSKSHTGKIRTEVHKRNLSISNKGQVPWILGKKHSIESRLKMSNATKNKPRINQRGEKNVNWKGGITEINHKIRTSLEYKLWREAVFKRDNWTCIWCGQVGGKLNADHIKRFSDYPELRFAIDNGRTLCEDCHKTTETYGRKNS